MQMCEGVCGGGVKASGSGEDPMEGGKGRKRKGIGESPRIRKGGNGEEDGEGKNRGDVRVPEV